MRAPVEDSLVNIHAVTSSGNPAPYGVEPRLKHNIHLMFLLNYFVVRQNISQEPNLRTVVTYIQWSVLESSDICEVSLNF